MMKRINQKYFKDPKKYIPYGCYCYDVVEGTNEFGIPNTFPCPFWRVDKYKPKQENGYCGFLGVGDWMTAGGMLWDQCKECDINWDDETEGGMR